MTPPTLDQWINPNEYYCIESGLNHDEPKNHVPDTGCWLNFLANFGSTGYNEWDSNADGIVNTTDLTYALTGFYTTPLIDPQGFPLQLLELNQTFGEGVSEFYPLEDSEPQFNGLSVTFVWFHATIGDEVDPSVTEDTESFKLEIVCGNTIYKYTFIKKTYLL